MTAFAESVVEDAALAWLKGMGYAVLHGPDIAAGEPGAERSDPNYRDVLLERRLRQALVRLNPDLPGDSRSPLGKCPGTSAQWSEASVHAAENVGTTDFLEIQIELKDAQ